jgi:hypothetical protein
MPPKSRKALKIEEFEPDEDILETTCKWNCGDEDSRFK